EWLSKEATRLGLDRKTNPVDIGVRVEVPAEVMTHITDVVYEAKFIYYSKSFDDQVRTFCMNPYGAVVTENNDGLVTVNGHSYADKRTANTNFALLVSKSFTEPFKEPITYGRYIASLANMLGGGVIVQRLGDLLSGRRSTPERIKRGLVRPTLEDATPGDLSLVLPYRHVTAIIEMLQALDKVAPGVYSRHTLLYGVEVKFYSARLILSDKLETKIEGLFAGGDGAGVTRSLAQASVAGVIIAREIAFRANR
ncbi:MAG: FAD-dependent oxidoreductase, partial [bacterium]|nr:FAD-dependent oxidoreductase [bacterium]